MDGLGIKPDLIVGDFDSAKPEILSFFRGKSEIQFLEFQPEKDETDTELALRLAISLAPDEICVLGATGNRVDHVLGNIQLLCKPLAHHIPCMLVDPTNRIRLVDKQLTMQKADQFGTYVSLLPLTTQAEGVTLEGFKYPLKEYCMTSDNSLGVSNEITEETARITVKKGILIMIESKD